VDKLGQAGRGAGGGGRGAVVRAETIKGHRRIKPKRAGGGGGGGTKDRRYELFSDIAPRYWLNAPDPEIALTEVRQLRTTSRRKGNGIQ